MGILSLISYQTIPMDSTNFQLFFSFELGSYIPGQFWLAGFRFSTRTAVDVASGPDNV